MIGFQDTFCCGAIFGFVMAGIIGIILGQIRESRNRIGARNRPLDTFPDASHPGMTSTGVVRKSIGAIFTCGVMFIFLIAVILFIVWIASIMSNTGI